MVSLPLTMIKDALTSSFLRYAKPIGKATGGELSVRREGISRLNALVARSGFRSCRCCSPAQYEATTDMANTPKKIKDPTEAALSAIQEALTARDAAVESEAASPPSTQPIEEPAAEPPWRTVRSEAPVEELRPPEQELRAPAEELRAPEEPSLLRRAANDDRESIGQILRTLQRRPGPTSYVTATVFAGLWVLAGLLLGWMYLPELQSALGPSGLAAP